METLEIKNRFIELRAKGFSFDKISKQLGKAKQTLIDWNKEFNQEILNLKALEIEVLNEKYFLTKEKRIETFGILLNNLKSEIIKRDLRDIPTDKLLDLFLKYSNQIQKEIVKPEFKTSTEMREEVLDQELLKSLTTLTTENNLLKVG
jgi:hypothetical protein